MALQDYAKPWLVVDGIRCAQITSIDLNTDGGKIPVYTLDRGWAGVTPGPGECRLTIGYVVPAGGYEYNFQSKCCSTGRHTIEVPIGFNSYIAEGEFMTDKQSISTRDSLSGTVEFMGEKRAIE